MEDNHNEDKDNRAHKDGGGSELEASRAIINFIATGRGRGSGLLGNLSSDGSGSGCL